MSNHSPDETQYFYSITPDRVLDAVESAGYRTTGQCLTLNSFENRVYDVELEASDDDERPRYERRNELRRVVKFYRPGRWSLDQILEEHVFVSDLAQSEVPAIQALPFPDGKIVHQMSDSGIYFVVFPKVGGRSPDELNKEDLKLVGRLLGRMHGVGAARPSKYRLHLNCETYGEKSAQYILEKKFVPFELRDRYEKITKQAFSLICQRFQETAASTHRLHGDCHFGNFLWNDGRPSFLDFDDMVIGPAVQDLWLMIGGCAQDHPELQERWHALLEGYEEMKDFDRRSLMLVEPLRTLRMIHYSAWIARRWNDPAFPLAFPHFGSYRYWVQEIEDLELQCQRMQCPVFFSSYMPDYS